MACGFVPMFLPLKSHRQCTFPMLNKCEAKFSPIESYFRMAGDLLAVKVSLYSAEWASLFPHVRSLPSS